jgi:hypothetical protein
MVPTVRARERVTIEKAVVRLEFDVVPVQVVVQTKAIGGRIAKTSQSPIFVPMFLRPVRRNSYANTVCYALLSFFSLFTLYLLNRCIRFRHVA